ncbi:DUF2397 family protein [Streptomyces sp. M19]
MPAATSWQEAEPVRISPQLRRTGSYERRGKPRRVTDRAEARRHLAELADGRPGRRRARAALVTDGEIRLSRLGELDPVAFALFLRLLGDALSTWRPDTTRTVSTSADGSMEIRLTALDDGSRAEIRTPSGVFRGPDHLVEIVDLTEIRRDGTAPRIPPEDPDG